MLSPMSSPGVALFFSLFLLDFLLLTAADGFNITEYLSHEHQFSTFNDYLTQTGVAGEINSQGAVTVLVVANANMSGLSSLSPDALKRLMSVHVILDYYDEEKLESLPNKATTLTTLYQKSGKAQNQEGSLRATHVDRGSGMSFQSAASMSFPNAILLSSIFSQPNKLSVLQVSNIIDLPSPSPAPGSAASQSPYNATQYLSREPQFSTFNNYLIQSGVADEMSRHQGALTVLVVANANMSGLSSLSPSALKKLMSVHVILDYYDDEKLESLPEKTTTLTTLYQQSGQAQNQEGLLQATHVDRGSGMSFQSASSLSFPNAILLSSIYSNPNKLSILQVSNIINLTSNSAITPSPAQAPAAASPSTDTATAGSPAGRPAQGPAASPRPAPAPGRKILSPAPSSMNSPPAASPRKPSKAPAPSNAPADGPANAPAGDTPPAADGPASSLTPDAADGPGSGANAKSSAVSVITTGDHLQAILMVNFITWGWFLLTMI